VAIKFAVTGWGRIRDGDVWLNAAGLAAAALTVKAAVKLPALL